MTTDLAARIRARLEQDAPNALVFFDRALNQRRYSGHQVLNAAQDTQQRLEAALGPGPHVLLSVIRFGEEFVFPFLAGILSGATMIAVAAPRRGDRDGRLAHMIELCRPNAILCLRAQIPLLEEILGPDRQVPLLALDDAQPQPDRTVPARAPFHSSSVPIIQFTSGTSRLPRAIALDVAPLLDNMEMVSRAFSLAPGNVSLNWAPHYHDLGLIVGLVVPLWNGAQTCLMDAFEMIRDPASWLRAISACRAEVAGGPPFAFKECISRSDPADLLGADLSSWRVAYCGAEPVPRGLFAAFHDRFAAYGLSRDAFFHGYGMAECTVFAAGSVPLDVDLPPEAMPPEARMFEPIALAPHELDCLRITDPESLEKMPEGHQGEIWISGAFVQNGYLADPEGSAESFGHPAEGRVWLRSGDLGAISAQRLYVTGRLKDMIIGNGSNFSAAEIEWHAAETDPRLNPLAAAVFIPGGGALDRVALWIEQRDQDIPDGPEVIDRIRRRIRTKFGLDLQDVRVLPCRSLPRTTSGKIQRQKLRGLSAELAMPVM
ncbi:fatty acyl-AMP ligase [Rhodobacter sp.]